MDNANERGAILAMNLEQYVFLTRLYIEEIKQNKEELKKKSEEIQKAITQIRQQNTQKRPSPLDPHYALSILLLIIAIMYYGLGNAIYIMAIYPIILEILYLALDPFNFKQIRKNINALEQMKRFCDGNEEFMPGIFELSPTKGLIAEISELLQGEVVNPKPLNDLIVEASAKGIDLGTQEAILMLLELNMKKWPSSTLSECAQNIKNLHKSVMEKKYPHLSPKNCLSDRQGPKITFYILEAQIRCRGRSDIEDSISEIEGLPFKEIYNNRGLMELIRTLRSMDNEGSYKDRIDALEKAAKELQIPECLNNHLEVQMMTSF